MRNRIGLGRAGSGRFEKLKLNWALMDGSEFVEKSFVDAQIAERETGLEPATLNLGSCGS